MLRRRLLATVVLALCLGRTQSASKTPPESSAPPTADAPEIVGRAWKPEGARAVREPAVVAGRIVAYTVNRAHLFLTVFDAETGEIVSGFKPPAPA